MTDNEKFADWPMMHMTAMEVFEFVRTHLLKQNARSSEPDSRQCLYRNSSGLSCAAGCLIPDDKLARRFDISSSTQGSSSWPSLVKSGEVPEKHARLISSLQTIHDSAVSLWPERLLELRAALIQHPERFAD